MLENSSPQRPLLEKSKFTYPIRYPRKRPSMTYEECDACIACAPPSLPPRRLLPLKPAFRSTRITLPSHFHSCAACNVDGWRWVYRPSKPPSSFRPPSMRWRGGGSGLKGRVPRQRLPQQWRHVTFLIGAGDIPPPAPETRNSSFLRSEQVRAQSCLSGHSGGSLIRVLASQE